MGSTPTSTRLRETLPSVTEPFGENLLYPRGFLPLPCKLPCRKSRLFSFSYKLQLSLRDFEDRRKDDDDDGGDGGDAQVVTAVGGGDGRRFGRKGRKETEKRSRSRRATSVRRSVGRTMGKSTPIIPSMQLAQCPLLKTVEAK